MQIEFSGNSVRDMITLKVYTVLIRIFILIGNSHITFVVCTRREVNGAICPLLMHLNLPNRNYKLLQ